MYNNKTEIFGITGSPLGHTFSPLIHNTLFQFYKYNGVYLVFEKEKPDTKFLKSLKSIGVKGLSVTIPHKEWAYKIAREKDFISSTMKASNTLVLKNDVIKAYNTDGPGAWNAVKNIVGKNSGNILILGSGGSASGIAFSIAQVLPKNKRIFISARNYKTSASLVKKINSIKNNTAEFIALEGIQKYSPAISLVIHTTPLGMKGKENRALLPATFFHKGQFLFDIVYNPLETELVKNAQKGGASIIPGYEMLLNQAYLQFELFTGIKPEKKGMEIVTTELLKFLK